MLSRLTHLFSFYERNASFLSDASEREAGHPGGGAGADGHRLSARGLRLPEERRGDVEGGRLCQQGGASGRHRGEVNPQTQESEPALSISTTLHMVFLPISPGLCRVCDYTRWSMAGAQLCDIPVPCFGPSVSPTGHADAC